MENRILHTSEYECGGCKYIITSYYSESATETLTDKLVKLSAERIALMDNKAAETPII